MDFVVVVSEQLQPAHLSMVQDPRFHKVFQVLMISEDVDWKTSPFKPVVPILKSFYDCKSLFVRNTIIPLSWIHGFRHKADQIVTELLN